MEPDRDRRGAGAGEAGDERIAERMAELIVRQEGRELRLALRLGVADHAIDLLGGRDAEGPNAGAGGGRRVGESEHRHTGLRRERGYGVGLGGSQRAEHDPGTAAERPL